MGLLTERLIKNINEILNKDIKDTKGYRTIQVFIRGSDYIPPVPEKISNLINYFVDNYQNNEEEIFSKISRYHIEFERIHPFEDGNSRTGGVLLNYELLKSNKCPVVITKEDRVKYFELLKNNDLVSLAKWLKYLSTKEKERIEKFGYKGSYIIDTSI